MSKKEYLAVHQLPSTLMSNDDISCYTVNSMEDWTWWHFWQEKNPNFYLLLISIQLLCNYWLRRQGRYFRIVPNPCDSCVFPPVFSPPQGWSHMLKEPPALPDHRIPAAGISLGSRAPLWLRLLQHSPETPSSPPANFQCSLTSSGKAPSESGHPHCLPQGKPHCMSRMGLTFLKLHSQTAFTFLQSFIKIPQWSRSGVKTSCPIKNEEFKNIFSMQTSCQKHSKEPTVNREEK